MVFPVKTIVNLLLPQTACPETTSEPLTLPYRQCTEEIRSVFPDRDNPEITNRVLVMACLDDSDLEKIYSTLKQHFGDY